LLVEAERRESVDYRVATFVSLRKVDAILAHVRVQVHAFRGPIIGIDIASRERRGSRVRRVALL
jgi:chorismate synthase